MIGSGAEPPPHTLPRLGVYTALDSSPRGLSSDEARRRLAQFGANELPRARGRPIIFRFFQQFTDLFAVVLIVASAITFLAYLVQVPHDPGNLQLAVAILGVVLLNAVIGFFQEYSAEKTAEALQAMVPRATRVMRDGERVEIPAAELVPGDVVVLEAGDAVSCDSRLVEAHDLSVNNVALTGESDPVGRTTDPSHAEGELIESRNCVFMGTSVVNGTGKAVAFATGLRTEFATRSPSSRLTASWPSGSGARAGRGCSPATLPTRWRSRKPVRSRQTCSSPSPGRTRSTWSCRCCPSATSPSPGSWPGSTTRPTTGCSPTTGTSTSPCRRPTPCSH